MSNELRWGIHELESGWVLRLVPPSAPVYVPEVADFAEPPAERTGGSPMMELYQLDTETRKRAGLTPFGRWYWTGPVREVDDRLLRDLGIVNLRARLEILSLGWHAILLERS